MSPPGPPISALASTPTPKAHIPPPQAASRPPGPPISALASTPTPKAHIPIPKSEIRNPLLRPGAIWIASRGNRSFLRGCSLPLRLTPRLCVSALKSHWLPAPPRRENPQSAFRNPQSPRSAFTLLELIAVIAIISILTALAFPVTARVTQGAKAAACISNLDSLGVALGLYLGEHNQIMPNLLAGRSSTTGTSQNLPVIDNTLNTYARDPRVFACPADNAGLWASTGTSYYWNSLLSGHPISNLPFFNSIFNSSGLNSEIPVLCDKQGFHPYAANKVNLLYADGHASQDLKFTTTSQ